MKNIAKAAFVLTLGVATLSLGAQSNEQTRKDAENQAKADRKASKAQAHADKEAHKALKSDKAKDAARAQDKADAAAAKANQQ